MANYVPVTNITGVSATAVVGDQQTIKGTVTPSNATYTAISWSIVNAGTTGASIDAAGVLSVKSAGTVTVLATIKAGASLTSNYTQQFNIVVSSAATATRASATAIAKAVEIPTVPTDMTTIANNLTTSKIRDTLLAGRIDTITKPKIEPDTQSQTNAPLQSTTAQTSQTSQPPPVVPDTSFVAVNQILSSTSVVNGSVVNGVPKNVVAGIPQALSVIAFPENATHKTITWSIADNRNPGSIIRGDELSAAIEGTVVVRATVKNGASQTQDFYTDFTISVNPYIALTSYSCATAYVPVGVPTSLGVYKNPYNATCGSAQSSVINAGSTGARFVDGKFIATASGVATIRYVVRNGASPTSDFVQDSTITVKPYVKVTQIINVPTTTEAGCTLSLLPGTVVPADASYKSIVWSVKEKGTTGAICSGASLFTNSAGTVMIQAKIENGTSTTEDFIQDFLITVTGQTAVTGISGMPDTLQTNGKSFNLNSAAVISPANATNKNISWSMINAGTTGATLSGNYLGSIPSAGTIKVRATIPSGISSTLDYVQDFTIRVEAYVAVTDINVNFPTAINPGTTLRLTGLVSPANATYKVITWSIVADSAINTTSPASISADGVLSVTPPSQLVIRATADRFSKDFTIDAYVPVTDITNVPTTAIAGTPLTLTGTVTPSNALNQTMAWSVVLDGSTGATCSSDGRLTTTAAGMVIVRATIKRGVSITSDYVKDFPITVSYVPVTNITNVPTAAIVGTPLTLTGTVVPSNATNKTIAWSVVSAGSTGATCSSVGVLSASAGGSVTVRATITNGSSATSNYVKDFSITVESNVLTLSKSVAKVRVSNVGTLTVTSGNTSGQAVTWSSNNPSVVTISNSGSYTGKQAGIAEITAKTADGIKTGRCKMYVYEDIVTSLGRGINILEADAVTSNFINTNNPVIDIDMLNLEGQVRTDPYLTTDFSVSVRESVIDVVNEFNHKTNVSYDGVFSASVDVNYDTKKTENQTTKFIKAMGYRSIRSEAIVNTQMNYLKAFLTDQFREDCASKSAQQLLRTYGSHVIAECCWGGIALVDAMYTSTKVTSNTKLETTVKASFGGFDASSTSVSTSEKDHFKKNTTETIHALGGSISAKTWDEFNSQYGDWYYSINSQPDVCGIKTFNENTTMLPLWKFVKEVSAIKAVMVEAAFRAACAEREIKLKGHKIYTPVVTDINVFAKSGSNHTSIPATYNHAVLNAFADKENNAEAFEDKKDQILDANKDADGAYINIFYKTGQVANYNSYAGNAISDVIVVNGKNADAPTGYTKVAVDLNQGAGGDYLYLAYKKATTTASEEIVDCICGAIYDKATVPNVPALDNGTWHWVSEYNSSGVQLASVADLNKGCGTSSKYIRLMVHKIARQKDPQ